jgi:hypothetical protein
LVCGHIATYSPGEIEIKQENSVLVKLGKPQIQVDRPYNYDKQKQRGRNRQEILCPSFVYQRVLKRGQCSSNSQMCCCFFFTKVALNLGVKC